MKRALFVQDGSLALKIGFSGDGKALLAIAKELRKSCVYVGQTEREEIAPFVSYVIPSGRLKALGFEIVENYNVDADVPIPVLSDEEGNCSEGEWDVHALDEVTTASLELNRDGTIGIAAECADDDGHRYRLHPKMGSWIFCDYLEKMALLSGKDAKKG